MTKLERMAEDYVDPLSADWNTMPYSPHVLNKLEDAYIAGFKAAREMALELLAEHYAGDHCGTGDSMYKWTMKTNFECMGDEKEVSDK